MLYVLIKLLKALVAVEDTQEVHRLQKTCNRFIRSSAYTLNSLLSIELIYMAFYLDWALERYSVYKRYRRLLKVYLSRDDLKALFVFLKAL